MSTTDAQRLAQAEATARRWLTVLKSMAGTATSDEIFSIVHRRWVAAERAVLLHRAGSCPPPPARRS